METRAILPRWVGTLGAMGRHRLSSIAYGRLVELQSTGHDITEQKRAELALQGERGALPSRRRGPERVHPAPAVRTARWSFVNDAYCRYRGLSREDLLGGFNDVYHYPPEQQATIHAAWAGLTPDFPSGTYELRKPCEGRRRLLGGMDRHGDLRADWAGARVPGDRP